MSWEIFTAYPPNSSTGVADGQCQFTRTITNGVLKAGATFQYSPAAASPPPNSTTLFTTTTDISLNAGNVYPIPDGSLPNSFNIPPKGAFPGGNYNYMTSTTYDPTLDKISGTFQDVPGGEDDDVSWSAEGGSQVP